MSQPNDKQLTAKNDAHSPEFQAELRRVENEMIKLHFGIAKPEQLYANERLVLRMAIARRAC